MINAAGFTLSAGAEAEKALSRLVEPVTREVPWENARSVENRITMAISAQSRRLRLESSTSSSSSSSSSRTSSLIWQVERRDGAVRGLRL